MRLFLLVRLVLVSALSDALGAYGEVSFIGSGDDDIDKGYGAKIAKIGLKYDF